MIFSIAVKAELAELDEGVAATKGQAVKASTRKNLLCHLNSYQQFCDRYLLQYFPADNRQLCRFGQHLTKTFQSSDSVKNYISGIRTCQALLGFEVPSPEEKQMQLFSQGLKNLLLHEIKQAKPITPQILLRISSILKFKDQTDMVTWVATLIGFYMFLRQSNLTPPSMEKFDSTAQFTRADFNLISPMEPMMAEVRWTKTLQCRQRVLRLPVLPVENKAVCPVAWFHHMVNTVPADPQDPAFTVWHKNRKLSLSTNQLLSRLRGWLDQIKEPSQCYSLHSLRRGVRLSPFSATLNRT